jgi:hypothetical protein
MNERYEAFLKDYLEICNKHHGYIGACGCCDSPWMIVWEEHDKLDDWEESIKEHEEHLRKS